MSLAYVPLLKVQRELYGMPRGMERFREYLRMMIDPATKDLRLPLAAMNPMGKEHVPALLDEYLKLDADTLAAEACGGVDLHGAFRASLVFADDAQGGWTNRWTTEFSHRFENAPMLKRGFVVGLLWTSEPPSAQAAREAVLCAAHRAAHVQRHGQAGSLREMLAQEGFAVSKAGCATPTLEAEDLAYTREVLAQHLDAKDRPTIVACLFGDPAAKQLGYDPKGLSPWAGLALALADSRA